MKTKQEINLELKDNYLKGGLIVCGLEEMTRHISSIRSQDADEIVKKVQELKNYVDSEKEYQRNTSRSGALDGTSKIVDDLIDYIKSTKETI